MDIQKMKQIMITDWKNEPIFAYVNDEEITAGSGKYQQYEYDYQLLSQDQDK